MRKTLAVTERDFLDFGTEAIEAPEVEGTEETVETEHVESVAAAVTVTVDAVDIVTVETEVNGTEAAVEADVIVAGQDVETAAVEQVVITEGLVTVVIGSS